MADRVTVMYAGRAVETGTCEQIFEKPRHPYTKGLIDCLPVLGRGERKRQLRSIRGLVPALIGEIAGCTFRNRCDHVRSACSEDDIPYRQASPGHFYRCVMQEAELEDILP
jgi:peptide/nickel transport system ATP-binding protein